MDNQLPDMSTTPMPITRPPQQRRKPWLVALLGVGVLLALGIVVSAVRNIIGSSPASSGHTAPTTQALATLPISQSTPSALPAAQATQTVSSAPPPHGLVTPVATPIIGQSSITHGRPRLGGQFSDFVGKYGPPTNQGDANSQNFWVGAGQTIDINVVRNDQGMVTQLNILGPDPWGEQQAKSYCTQFLPDNAVQFNATANQVGYHSSAGDLVLAFQSRSCLLAFARY